MCHENNPNHKRPDGSSRSDCNRNQQSLLLVCDSRNFTLDRDCLVIDDSQALLHIFNRGAKLDEV